MIKLTATKREDIKNKIKQKIKIKNIFYRHIIEAIKIS